MLSVIRNTPLEYVSVTLTMRGSSYAYIDTIRYLGSVSAVIAICRVVHKKAASWTELLYIHPHPRQKLRGFFVDFLKVFRKGV